MSEKTNRTDAVLWEVRNYSGCKPKGGEKLAGKIGNAVMKGGIDIFIPWAAPANGRTEIGSPELQTIEWLFDSNGLKERLKKFFDVNSLVMFADTYALRNNFDITKAKMYWRNVSDLIGSTDQNYFTATSVLEDSRMVQLRAREAYAFERLEPKQQEKILEAAEKYSSKSDYDEVYEAAAEYSMLRAAEAAYVNEAMDAVWVSLNWPERDIMCGDVPRLYIPEELRAPWLKGG